MPQVTFQQGEDIIIELPIVDGASPIDLTGAHLRVQLYVNKNNTNKKYFSYSDTPKSGYGVCRQKGGTGNENIIEVLVKRSESVTFDVGVLSFAVVVTMPGNEDFPNGINQEYDFPSYGTVLAGDAKDEIIP